MVDRSLESQSSSAPTPRVIGVLAAICIVVGSTFGIGIFISPAEAATHLPDAPTLLMLFLGAGLLSLGGAFACSELGAMIPKAGGDYVFQRAAFGRSVAFASGWLLVVGVFAGGIASMTVAVCEFQFSYVLSFIAGREIKLNQPLLTIAAINTTVTGAQVGAASVTILYTLLNVWGTKQSARVQTLCTLVPFSIVALMAMITLPMSPQHVVVEPSIAEPPRLSATNLVLAYLPVFFAYSGWNVIIYVGGEVRDPGRTIPRALIIGLLAITALYTLLCTAFSHALGIDGLRAVHEQGIDAGTATAATFFGQSGRVIMTVLMTIALLTCINGSVLTGARIAFAMARDGAFWSRAGVLSKRETPSVALWLQCALTCALIFTGTFSELYQICSIAMILGGSLNVLALFALRWKHADAHRPYRAWLYPWLPGAYLMLNLFAIGIMGARAMFPDEHAVRPWLPLLGVGLFAAVWIAHRLLRRT